jgi:hypothetical protein
MPMNWQVFDKAQDDDLVADLARRQADEEGRRAILTAMEQQQAARANESIRRDNAETNRVYREGLIAQRERDNENDRIRNEAEAGERTLKTKTMAEQRTILQRIANDPNADPQDRRAATMQLAGMNYAPLKIGGGTKGVHRVDRQDGSLKKLGDVGENDVVQLEPAEPRVNVTMPGTGLNPNQYRAAIRDLHQQYTTDTANERVIMGKYGLMQTAWNEFSKNPSFRDPAGQTLLVTFQKVLDPESVVRESEYARSVEGQALTRQLAGWWQKITTGGPAVSNADLQAYMNTMRAWAAEAQKYHDAKKSRIKLAADDLGIPMDRIAAEVPGQTSVVDPAAAKTDALGAAAGAVRDAAPAANGRKNPLGLPPPRGRK